MTWWHDIWFALVGAAFAVPLAYAYWRKTDPPALVISIPYGLMTASLVIPYAHGSAWAAMATAGTSGVLWFVLAYRRWKGRQ